jgi:hypothetical protein
MGKIVARNMSSQIGFINEPLLLHLVGFLLYHRFLLLLIYKCIFLIKHKSVITPKPFESCHLSLPYRLGLRVYVDSLLTDGLACIWDAVKS